jgi:transglutaminase-like putative cysteine protease
MNRYRLAHVTEFRYDGIVSESYNEVRLRPRQDEYQSCLSFRLKTQPNARLASHMDMFNNWVHHFNVMGEHRLLTVETDSVVLVHQPPEMPENGYPLSAVSSENEEVDQYYDLLLPTDYVPHAEPVRELVAAAEKQSSGTVSSYARAAAALVHDTIRYEKGATHVQSSILDALENKAGVCQDFAHVLLAVLRIRGLPARYVSGYLVPRKTAEPGASAEEVIGGQASHAWTEVLIPGAGWFGMDPTLGTPIGLQHVRVAYGRDYGDVAPVRGVYKGHAGQRLSVDVRVRPALDDEGIEHLAETAAAPPQLPPEEAPPQQQQQQQ